MKNFRLLSLLVLALLVSLSFASAYTPLLANNNRDKNIDNKDNVYIGIPALACDVGYYGYNCKNSGNSGYSTNTYSNTDTYYFYDTEDYYYNYNYRNNYYTDYRIINPPKKDYRIYNQADKLYYQYTYDVKEYRVYNPDYQVRYLRANPDRCATRGYVYPCDFYYGEIH